MKNILTLKDFYNKIMVKIRKKVQNERNVHFLKGVVKMNKKETVIKFTVDENTAHNLEEVSDFTKKT